MTTTVNLPSNFNYGSMYAFTAAIVSANGVPRDREFTFDFGRLQFIDGSGLTVFCNTLEWLYSHDVKVTFQNHVDVSSDSIRYLDDCGFFERHLGRKLRTSASVRGTTLPFMRVAHADAHGWLEYDFTPWMSGVFGVPHGALASVRTCVKEVFNNIIDHSTQNIGFVHVQHYPKINRVRVTVSDFGKGIPSNIKTSFPALDDGAAILEATKPGFTTKSTPRNMGVGLDFLIESVTGNKGSVSIYSFKGAVTCHRNASGVMQRHSSLGNGSYPGTLVELSLPTDCFVGDDVEEEEEMSW
ncbi:ATP-binding protein [uncultured Sphingomonas sp.]|uniref:ATP-binding protein n=1 Tax=uncultured Sphingomonas sp. TaxID=158754 RepID=UPI0035CC9337